MTTKLPTRKEALAHLYRLNDAYVLATAELDAIKHEKVFDSDELQNFRLQTHRALRVLTIAIHGRHALGTFELCDQCFLSYGTQHAWYHDEQGKLQYAHCCPTCYRRLEQQHTLISLEEARKEIGL